MISSIRIWDGPYDEEPGFGSADYLLEVDYESDEQADDELMGMYIADE